MKLRKDQRRRRIQELTYLCKQAADRGDELGCWMYAAMVEELGGKAPRETVVWMRS